MKIKLEKEVSVVIQEEKSVLVSYLIINELIDNGTAVIAKLTMGFMPLTSPIKYLVLWDGEEYNKIGDWTQAQAEERIKQLI